MSQSLDDTQPTKPMPLADDTQPKPPRPIQPPPNWGGQIPYPAQQPQDDEGSDGPGCFVWGIMGVFSLIIAVIVVIMAGYAGWSQGLQVAHANATATVGSEIQTQCDLIPAAVESGSTGLLQQRLEFLMEQTPSVSCLVNAIPTATALYINSLPTATPTITETPAPTLTLTATVTNTGEPTMEPTVAPTENPSGFDLEALLAEAQTYIDEEEWLDAIDLLDAIIAIDPTFRKGLVEQLLYQALTSQAQIYFRSGESLAEGIVLTDRAEEFGDVGELGYERFLAELYLDGVRNLGMNNQRAAQIFTRIVVEQGLPNYLDSARLMVDAYEGYGDDLAAGGDYCGAIRQYDTALSYTQRASVSTKRSEAAAFCSGTTVTPGATVEEGAIQAQPTQPAVAPVGVVDP